MANTVDYEPCQYRGNGSTRTFSYTWKTFVNTDLVVQLETVSTGTITTLTLGTDYSVAVESVGGSVTLTTAPSSDYYVNIKRNISQYQPKGYSTSTGFQGSEIENSFDKVSCNLQEMQYGINTFETATNTKVSNIQTQVNTANTNANTAITTANSATSTASTALSTANTASSNASTAVTTANSASSSATSAVSTANTANTTANSASALATETSERVDEFEEEIEEVKEAAAKINQLEQAVATAVAKAGEATQSAQQAQTAATTATQKATEISASATQIQTNKTNIATLTTNQGTISDLTTTATNLVGAVNEVLNTSNTKDGDLTTLQTTAKNNLVSAINELSSKKANIICYLDRDFEYKHPKYMTADKSTITILAGTAIRLKNNTYFYTASDRTYSIDSILDTGSVSNGKDYYFYLNNDSELIASLSETNPLDYSADEVVRIGGAHTMCVTLGNDTPSLLADSFWTEHPYKGYSINDFMPNTIWTPAFKSGAKTGNKGQALIEHYGLDKFWGDIYLQSGTGTATASDYSGTITNNRQCILHQWDMNQVGKKFPTDQQFTIMSEGSNQQTNIAGSAIPSGRLTGGYKDTAGKWMISGFGIWCCCGYLWQWGDEIAPVGGSGWSAYGDTRRGASYGMPYVLLFGGDYATSSNCGSWSRVSHSTRTYAYVNGGGRGVSLHIERQHK